MDGLRVWGTEEAALPSTPAQVSAEPDASPSQDFRPQTHFYLLGERRGGGVEVQDPGGESLATVRGGEGKGKATGASLQTPGCGL